MCQPVFPPTAMVMQGGKGDDAAHGYLLLLSTWLLGAFRNAPVCAHHQNGYVLASGLGRSPIKSRMIATSRCGLASLAPVIVASTRPRGPDVPAPVDGEAKGGGGWPA